MKNLQDIPGMIAGAFTGGGGIGGAIKGIGTGLASTLGSTIGKTFSSLGSLGGPIGSAIGSLAGPLIDMFGKIFKSPEKQINPIRQAFVDMAGGLDKLNQKAFAAGTTLNKLLDAKNPQQYQAAIEELQKAFQFQTDTMQLLDETTKRYGFTLEELGPALQRQELDKQAQQLYQDWQVLNSAGIDTIAITTRMADSVNAYVQQALGMGTEVPIAMKPMLEQMAKMGLLTDATGTKIEDVEGSGITFAMTMSEGFKSLIDTVKQLTDVISRGLHVAIDDTANALASIPTDIGVNIHYNDPGAPAHELAGDVPGFATGTGGKFVNFGAGSLAMLHGREAIVPEGEATRTDEHLIGMRQDLTELRQALVAEQRMAPERLMLALRGVLAFAR
jgi:hypothetical protein